MTRVPPPPRHGPQYRPNSSYNSEHWTTNGGAPVWNNNNSLTVGERGKRGVWEWLSRPDGGPLGGARHCDMFFADLDCRMCR